jgi:hypothetical protein
MLLHFYQWTPWHIRVDISHSHHRSRFRSRVPIWWSRLQYPTVRISCDPESQVTLTPNFIQPRMSITVFLYVWSYTRLSHLIHGLLTWYGLFSLLCILCSVLFCDIVLLCVSVLLMCIVLFIVLALYCVCLWCTCCYPNWGFSVFSLSCKANARL